MLTNKYWIYGVLLCFLSGCAVQMKEPAATSGSWERHFTKMSRLTNWHLTAKVGIQTQDQGSGSMVIDWQQGLNCYRIQFSSGFGQTVANLVGHKGRVTLSVPGKEPVKAETLEDLGYLQTGWWIPFSYLQYWTLGIPAPFSRFNIEKDKNNRLKTLEQADWLVTYDRYKTYDDHILPSRITAKNQDMKIILVTRDWVSTENKNPVIKNKQHSADCKDTQNSDSLLYDTAI